ncbi:hypothetical protein [Falsiroseomonas sp. HW251]|uniref:hypothetical protein n=1 Tax=Falsiroseomonas sp. HW251 TaxID=3390998 RepID=UPI003D319438
MAFDNTSLLSLATTSGFTLWYYRTQDTRATALAAGYFSGASARLVAGDVILLQASDALGLTTVRTGTTVPGGLVVDTFAAPFKVNRSAAKVFSVRQVATAVAVTILLAPLGGGITAGSQFATQASVSGPVAQVSFEIRDAAGATVAGPTTGSVTSGIAAATLTAPPAGSGYRLRAEAVGFPLVADTSAAFSVSIPYALLTQAGDTLVAQDGARLAL